MLYLSIDMPPCAVFSIHIRSGALSNKWCADIYCSSVCIIHLIGSNEVCAQRQDEIDGSDDEDEPAELMKRARKVSHFGLVILLALFLRRPCCFLWPHHHPKSTV